MSFSSICNDIKTLKIQGAISVAKEGAKAFYFHINKIDNTPSNILKEMKIAAKKLIQTRSTEPALRNALAYYFYYLNMTSTSNMKTHLEIKYHEIMNHFSDSKKTIINYGINKIKNGMIVYTHCHSSIVCDILLEAKKRGKKFEVYNTETRPLFQGRKTAKQLSDAGIKVKHFVDSAARHAIKKADIVLIGSDAITTTKIYNKIGSETIALLSSNYDVPVYCCTDSWKYDPLSVFGFDEEIEKRISKEVWNKPPKNVSIYNYAFDMIDPKYITGIISEIGVFTHSIFIEEVNNKLKEINKFFNI